MKRTVYRHVPTLLIILAFQPFSQEIVTGVTFEVQGRVHQSDELRDVAEKLVKIPVDHPLDTAALRQSVEALKLCRLFESVAAEQSAGRITFHLTQARYVRDIRIHRELPLFEDEVRKAMITYPGDIFCGDILAKQDSLITVLYRRQGFVSPSVEVTSREHRKGWDRVVLVHVDAGKYFRLKTLEIRGNRAISDIAIKRRMNSWRVSMIPGSAGRFVESTLHEDIKALTEHYKSERFADIEICDTVIVDSTSRRVRVILSIREGDRYRIRFSRRHDRRLRKAKLREDIAIFKTGNRNNHGIRKSVKAIKSRLHESGFLDAQVTVSDTAVFRRRFTERLIYFSVNAGPRTTVSSIIIQGASVLDEETVRGQMLHVDKGSTSKRAYNPDRLYDDVFAIQSLYRSRGFLRATVASAVDLKCTSVAIKIKIDEGSRTLIGKVEADVNRFPDIDTCNAITLSRGDSYRKDLLKRGTRVLQTMIAEQGYPHAVVTPSIVMNDDSSRADVTFLIDEGPMVTMGDIKYVGAFRTRERVLRRELKAMLGKPLSLKDIVDTQNGVRDLGVFSTVRFRTIGLREKWDTVHMFVEVTEKKPYYGMVGGGYQSDKGPFMHAKVGDNNVLGLNKEAWVGCEISQIGYRGETCLLGPRLLGSRLRALVEVFGEKTSEINQNWVTTAYGISAGLNAPVGKHLVLGLGTGYERRRLSVETGNAPATSDNVSDDQRPRNIVVTTQSLVWDRRDSFTRPRKGVFLGSSVDISKSMGTTLDNFVKAHLEAKGYTTPFPTLTLAGVVRVGYLKPYGGSQAVPADKRFYLGGTGDVRGFAENLFHPSDSGGGEATMSASIEARIEIGLNIELAVFTDIGRLENDFVSISPDQFRSSTGTGIRYITPIGPIGILYGWKLGREPGEDIGAFHFSLGYTF